MLKSLSGTCIFSFFVAVKMLVQRPCLGSGSCFLLEEAAKPGLNDCTLLAVGGMSSAACLEFANVPSSLWAQCILFVLKLLLSGINLLMQSTSAC